MLRRFPGQPFKDSLGFSSGSRFTSPTFAVARWGWALLAARLGSPFPSLVGGAPLILPLAALTPFAVRRASAFSAANCFGPMPRLSPISMIAIVVLFAAPRRRLAAFAGSGYHSSRFANMVVRLLLFVKSCPLFFRRSIQHFCVVQMCYVRISWNKSETQNARRQSERKPQLFMIGGRRGRLPNQKRPSG